jgi:transposase
MELGMHKDEQGNSIPVPVEVWATFPIQAQAVILLLMAKIEALEEQLRANSTNSSKPPSADPPGTPRRRKASAGRRPGGQPGHPGHTRDLLPDEKVTRRQDCYPEKCRKCGTGLPAQACADPIREQVVELPAIEPIVTEFVRHKVVCQCCSAVTTGERPAGAPPGCFGPRLLAFCAMLTARFRMSRRDVEDMLSNTLGISISLGCVSANEERVSEALAKPVEEVHVEIQRSDTVNADDTSWVQQNQRASIFGICTPIFAAYFVTEKKDAATAKKVLGEFAGFLGTDRSLTYSWYDHAMHQTCLAHIDRHLLKISQRTGPSKKIGEAALKQMDLAWGVWHAFKAGEITADQLLEQNRPIEDALKKILEDGENCGHAKTEGTCANILDIWNSLWLYTYLEGVEPTNNSAERALRPGVRWRKTSFGSQSDRGSRFVERMLTVVETCRRQGRHLLDYLTACVANCMRGLPAPSLVPAAQPP